VLHHDEGSCHALVARAAEQITVEVEGARLAGVKRTTFSAPGLTSLRTLRSGMVNPCFRSSETISITTGWPFFTVISFGLYSNFFAVS
jgi:hypothetical protein